MTLGEKQKQFVKLIGKLIDFAYASGYELSFGEALRPPEMAKIYAKQKKGKANSLHIDKLAIDLNLFRDGIYLDKTEDHRGLGKFWETLGTPECRTIWGGRFGDGNHYSIAHEGRM